MTSCKIADCQKSAGKGCQGYCSGHYQRLRRRGLLERKRAPHGQRTSRKCNAEGCERTTEKGGGGYCGMHYLRLKKTGRLDRDMPVADDIKTKIIAEYQAGESTIQIGRNYGLTDGKVSYWLHKWGVHVRSGGVPKGSVRKKRKTDGFGYVLIYKPDHPNAVRGFVREHRVVMEEMLGRLLEPIEIVHHINNNPSDNRPENLVVMLQTAHGRHHKSRHGTGKRHEGQRFITVKCICLDCGAEFKRRVIGLCRKHR